MAALAELMWPVRADPARVPLDKLEDRSQDRPDMDCVARESARQAWRVATAAQSKIIWPPP